MSYSTYDQDPPMIVTIGDRIRKAKKEHVCDVCKEPIKPWTSYRYFVYLDDDLKFQVAKYHVRCDTEGT